MSQHDMQNYRYNVEYRVVGTDEHGSWIQSNHQPTGPGEFRYLGFVYLYKYRLYSTNLQLKTYAHMVITSFA